MADSLLYAGRHKPTLAPSLDQSSDASLVACSGRQQQVAMEGRNVGNGRVREGEIVSPRPSLSQA